MPSLARRAGPFVLLLLLSCATAPRPAQEGAPARVIEGVPFHAQEAYRCGPASLAGVLNFWGVAATPEEIAESIWSPTAKGTLDIDMAPYARKRGLDARQYSGSVEDIRANLDSGRPLIVLVDLGLWLYRQDHFMVVVGYSGDGLIVNSGGKERKFVPVEKFLKSWEKTGRWTLLVRPE